MASSTTIKWHKNYTRLMPYYYVNHKAKLIYSVNPTEEKLVRVRKIIKTLDELVIELVEKVDNVPKKGEKKSRKRLREETLKVEWEDLEEISFQILKSSKWSLVFIR